MLFIVFRAASVSSPNEIDRVNLLYSIWFYFILFYPGRSSCLHSQAAWGCDGCPPGQSQRNRCKCTLTAKYVGRPPPAVLTQCTVSGCSAPYGCVPTWTIIKRTAALCDWAWRGSTSGPTPPWRCSWATPGCRGGARQVHTPHFIQQSLECICMRPETHVTVPFKKTFKGLDLQDKTDFGSLFNLMAISFVCKQVSKV